MTEPQITLEEALKLVDFTFDEEKGWQVEDVKGGVTRRVWGNVDEVRGTVSIVWGDVAVVTGNVIHSVWGNVGHSVKGDVQGTINSKEWKFVETPKENN